MTSTTITMGNYKGGVGKTTATQLFAYILSEKYNKKVLAVDTDPQSNLTETLALTFSVDLDTEKNLYNACFTETNPKENVQSLSNNLDILSGSWDMINFEAEVYNQYKAKYINQVIKNVLIELKDDYDYILIDTAPTTNLVMENVLMFTDYILVATQTVPLAYESTLKFYDYLLDFYEADNTDFELLGVLPYLVGKSATDRKLIKKYESTFEHELFHSHIRSSDRVKTWSDYGITEDKPYDKVTLEMYEKVVEESLERLNGKVD